MGRAGFEIELKSLLTQEQYEHLLIELPKLMQLIQKESLHTIKFKHATKPIDIRLRYSDITHELVCKNGSATDISRKEISIPLKTKNDIDHLQEIFSLLELHQDPSWVTHRMDLEYQYKNYTYSASLQYTERFAYILEIEYMDTSSEHHQLHEQHIREIFEKLGCDPINNEEFHAKIKAYIANNKLS